MIKLIIEQITNSAGLLKLTTIGLIEDITHYSGRFITLSLIFKTWSLLGLLVNMFCVHTYLL